jgi:hypothetical protein
VNFEIGINVKTLAGDIVEIIGINRTGEDIKVKYENGNIKWHLKSTLRKIDKIVEE